MERTEVQGPKVSVTFTKSSSKDAGEGYSITVHDSATKEDVDRTLDLAVQLKAQADAVVKGDE